MRRQSHGQTYGADCVYTSMQHAWLLLGINLQRTGANKAKPSCVDRCTNIAWKPPYFQSTTAAASWAAMKSQNQAVSRRA